MEAFQSAGCQGAGALRAGPIVRKSKGRKALLDHAEIDHAEQPEHEAVDRERVERAGLEVADQEPDRDVRAEAGQDAAEQDLAVDAVTERARQVGHLEHSGGQDDRGGPGRAGPLTPPGAGMTGVASRTANRAASSRDRPRAMPVTMVTPSRLIPASRARICDAPMMSASPKPIRASRSSE